MTPLDDLTPPDKDLSGEETNLQVQAFRLIRQEIILGRYRPGEKLTINRLVSELGIGRTPVRESLVRLQETGLVRVAPQSGTYVSRISLSSAENGRYLRETVESQVFAECCAKASPADIDRFAAVIRESEEAARLEDRHRFFQLDRDFHRIAYDAIGRSEIFMWLSFATIALDRYRWLRLYAVDLPWRSIIDDHQEILDSIRRREVQEASYLVSQHLHAMLSDITSVTRRFPDYFEEAD